MGVLVLVETAAIAALGLLVCGLLRSHAEILRALDRVAPQHRWRATPARLGTRRPPTSANTVAVDVTGTTPAGTPALIELREARRDTLLAFLSSGCHTCGGFWRTLRDGSPAAELPAGTRIVVVAKGPPQESLERIGELTGEGVTVVMSTEAWGHYQVPVTPYFVHVEARSGQVVGQGSGATWAQVASLLRQARGDDRFGAEAEVDRQLLAAGVRPGDPSLYPSRAAAEGE